MAENQSATFTRLMNLKKSIKWFYSGVIFEQSDYYTVKLLQGDPLRVEERNVGYEIGQDSHPEPRGVISANYIISNDKEKLNH